jgi:GDP-L-fucose synthase
MQTRRGFTRANVADAAALDGPRLPFGWMSSARPDPAFWSGKRVVVTGGAGFLGRPTAAMLEELGAEVGITRSAEHDLRDRDACRAALEGAQVVIHLAANVGGIGYNRRNPGPLAHDNLAMGLNVFECCRELETEKLVAACSVCAYPKFTPVPFSEDELWNGYPEESNAPYGLAKRMLIVLSDSYRRQYGVNSCVPVIANLYGPGDNFDLEDSHVIAAMIHKFAAAAERGDSEVVLWGTGEPSREFLYVDDAARALILAAERYDSSDPVNIGTGSETKIRDLAETISRLAGFEGEIVWDTERPDGQPRRYLDTTRAADRFGFGSEMPLEEGLRRTLESFTAADLIAG